LFWRGDEVGRKWKRVPLATRIQKHWEKFEPCKGLFKIQPRGATVQIQKEKKEKRKKN